MDMEIQGRFEKLEARRQALVERVRALPPEKQKQKPASKAFSALEIIMHFALAEASNNGFLKKAPPTTLKGRKVSHGIFYGPTLLGLQSAGKIVTSPPMFVPKGEFTLDQADKAWALARRDLARYLEQVERPEAAFIKFLFFFGTLSALDYLSFTEAHMHYHETRFPVKK
jgi:hypothetical protein